MRHASVAMWDLANGCQHTLSGHTGPVESVALSANGRWALSGSWTIKLWALDWEFEIVDEVDEDEKTSHKAAKVQKKKAKERRKGKRPRKAAKKSRK